MVVASACALTGCSNELPLTPSATEAEAGFKVTATAGMPQGNPDTRLDFREDDKSLIITWKTAGERFSVMKAAAAAPTTFEQTGIDADHHKATFEGTIADREGDYYALYPALGEGVTAASAANLALDMNGQSGSLDESKVYMYGKTTYNGGLAFQFGHLTCVLQLTLSFPDNGSGDINDMDKEALTRAAAGEVTGVTLTGTGLSTSAQVDLTGGALSYSGRTSGMLQLSGSFTPEHDDTYKVHLHLLPNTMSKLTITAEKDGKMYVGTVLGATETGLQAGKMYTKAVEMEQLSTFDSTIASGAGIEPALLNNSNGQNSEDNPYLIASPENLRWLIKQLEGTTTRTRTTTTVNPTTGKYYRLTTDIAVTTDAWTPIGSTKEDCFDGHFDGNGHIISGTLTNPSEGGSANFGFFGHCGSNSTISNLNMVAEVIDNYYVANGLVGSVVGLSEGFIVGCTNKGKVTTNNANGQLFYVGGIAGACNNISDCVNAGRINSNNSSAYSTGGIAGGVSGNCSGCSNSAEVNASKGFVGGILGLFVNDGAISMAIENCTNTGIIKSSADAAGGIVGVVFIFDIGSVTLTNCINNGDVEGNGLKTEGGVGGIVGATTGDANYHLCHNSGTITATDSEHVGAICGLLDLENLSSDPGKVYNCCTNTGTPARFVGNIEANEECGESHT